MMLRDIWKNFNVSLVMVLPIFQKITDNIISKRDKLKFPFPQLAFEYGLLNTFLLRDNKFDGRIYLLFDREKFTQDLNITRSKYFSMCELLVDSEYFQSVELYNDYVVIGLQIPEEYYDDIKIILKGSYNSLSRDYKNEIYFRRKMTHIPEGENKYGMYLVGRDLAYGIAIKDIRLRDELKDLLGYSKTINEYYPVPSEKENFSLKIVERPEELLKV